jgi:hypothetical protein
LAGSLSLVRPEGFEPPAYCSVAEPVTLDCFLCGRGPVVVTADDRTMQELFCFACGRTFSVVRDEATLALAA